LTIVWLLTAICALVLILALTVFLIWVGYSRKVLSGVSKRFFLPSREMHQTPADFGVDYEEHRVVSIDERGAEVSLSCWFVPAKESSVCVLFFHGNQGNISDRRETIKLYSKLGLSCFYVDYQGYGASEGTCSMQALEQDALASFDYLVESLGIEKNQIIVHGRSMGGYPASYLSSNREFGGLIVESSFTCGKELLLREHPWLLIWGWKDSFPLQEHLMERAEKPLMILHSPADERIPYSMSQTLVKSYPGKVELKRMQGSHDTGFLATRPRYDQWLLEFANDMSSSNSHQKVAL